MSARKVIAWDIDDVLFPWYDKAHELCVRDGLGLAPEIKPTTWFPYEEYGVPKEEWFEILAIGTVSGALYTGEPAEGATRVVDAFDELGYEQHFITARGFMQHADVIRSSTVDWLFEHFGHITHTLHFSQDKGVEAKRLGVTHAIDDNIRNWQSIAKTGARTFLLDQPWNREHNVGDSRVKSLDEFAEAVVNGGSK